MNWNKLACTAVLCALPQVSHALLLDFSQVLGGAQGNLLVDHYVIPNSPLTVDAFYLKGNNYTKQPDGKGRPVTLFVRNDDDDLGFGVCAPEDQTKSACDKVGKYKGGGGDTNELDNAGSRDMLRFTIAAGWKWDFVKFSTLSKDEGGQLWYTDSPGLDKDLSSFASRLKSYNGPKKGSFLDLDLSRTAAAEATYLYFVPTGDDAGHMIWQMGVTQVPEPATVVLMAMGFGLLGIARLRKSV